MRSEFQRPIPYPEGELSRVTHELRSPLNTVLGMAEILAEGELSAAQRRQVEMLQRAGNRMLALVNELCEPAIATPSGATAAPLPSGDAHGLAGLRLLVVDDSDECQAIVVRYLASTGAVLTGVSSCGAARRLLERKEFDGALVDLRLPDGSGLEVVRAIRRAESDRGAAQIPIFALSADVLPSTVSTALEAGCSAHIAKPVARLTLLSALMTGFERSRSSPGPTLTARFLSHRSAEIASARAALDRGDFEHLAMVGHKLQGTGGSYGFPAMSVLGRRIEAAADAREASALSALLGDLASAVSDAAELETRVPRAKPLSGIRKRVVSQDRRGYRGR
jgi:CheY-like chemotaxis protein